MNKNKNFNLDLIRAIAVFFVLSTHFFQKNGMYDEIITGKRLYVAVVARTAFLICVPAFLMLTGYLMHRKTLSKKFYKGLGKTLSIYLLSTIVILLYRNFFRQEGLSLWYCIRNITSFSQYSWYIEMYIGLFLLIPFLNIMYHGCKEKKQKLVLVLSFLILTTLPSMVNTYGISLAPAWWTDFYPLSYYFIGAYISEYKDEIRLPLRWNAILAVVAILFSGSYAYIRSYGQVFNRGAWISWGGFLNVMDTVLVFLFLCRVNLNGIPVFFKKIITKISELSLCIYLVSWIFDTYSYPKLNNLVPVMPERLIYYLAVVPFVFACSFITAFFIHLLYQKSVCFMNYMKNTKNKETI